MPVAAIPNRPIESSGRVDPLVVFGSCQPSPSGLIDLPEIHQAGIPALQKAWNPAGLRAPWPCRSSPQNSHSWVAQSLSLDRFGNRTASGARHRFKAASASRSLWQQNSVCLNTCDGQDRILRAYCLSKTVSSGTSTPQIKHTSAFTSSHRT